MSLTIQAPVMLSIAMIAAASFAAVLLYRRVAVRLASVVLLMLGAFVLAAAAGGLSLVRQRPARLVVMVDLSGSTRGAAYRDEAALRRRVGQLIPGARYEIRSFGEQADLTRWEPPVDCDAVLLFSDGNLELPPIAPSTFAVVDPGLIDPADAAVVDLEQHEQERLSISLRNRGPAQTLLVTGASPATQPAPAGRYELFAQSNNDATSVSATLSAPNDLWPENDRLSLELPPPARYERWWVGQAPPDADWRRWDPANLPADAASYLLPSVIVLNDIFINALNQQQLHRLFQYARDLGAGLIILGGEHAFAAGGYTGSILEGLSPLVSNPPVPVRRWIILIDSSGSMASPLDGSTRFQAAAGAVTRVLSAIPPDDFVSVGHFAKDVRWWLEAQPAKSLDVLDLPIAEVQPSGPTNLRPVLEQIAKSSAATPTEVMVVSDAETEIADVAALGRELHAAHTRVHLLALRDVPERNSVREVVRATSGLYRAQADPQAWTLAMRDLLTSALPGRWRRERITARFSAPLSDLPATPIDMWNRTWLRQGGTSLASAQLQEVQIPLIAMQNVGNGRSVAAAYLPDPRTVNRLVQLAALAPRDPRFAVRWSTVPELRVRIEAVENGTSLNDLKFTVSSLDKQFRQKEIPQTGPGRYELALGPLRSASVLLVQNAGKMIDRRALAGRYAREFDRIGTDFEKLRELARRTNGRVVEPSDSTALELSTRVARVDLTTALVVSAGFALAAALLMNRRG
ncbi:MAG TPA: vWA domain-containing protein [Tepidisphaeraceae bacterium]|jgi:hypothetical protein